jgi:hypothetical protein
MKTNFVIHVGFSRTGTTTLQKHLFSKHSQIHYLGKPYRDEHLGREISRLIKQDTMVYDSSAIREVVNKNVGDGNLKASRRVILLSDEILVSYSKALDRGTVARRLKEIFQPRILFTIRNQYEILKSAYLSRGRLLLNVPNKYSGLTIGFKEWLEMAKNNVDRSYLGHVDYLRTIRYYSKLFGDKNVCILLLEEFIHDRGKYLEKLCDFLKINVDEALELTENKHEHQEIKQWQFNFERFRSYLYPLSRLPLIFGVLKPFFYFMGIFNKGKITTVSIPKEWYHELKELYAEGNRVLVDDYQLPLGKYGYPL